MTAHETSSRVKSRARYSLLGHLGTAVWAVFLYFFFSFLLIEVASAVSGTGVLSYVLAETALWLVSILLGIFHYGLCSVFMDLQYERPSSAGVLFQGFRENTDRIVPAEAFLAGMQILLLLPGNLCMTFVPAMPTWGSWLLLAAGFAVYVYIDLTFALYPYLLLDYPSLSTRAALSYSSKLMRGSRRRLLWLSLSFLPLYALSVLSLGIAALWVAAYHGAANAAFYRNLLDERARR